MFRQCNTNQSWFGGKIVIPKKCWIGNGTVAESHKNLKTSVTSRQLKICMVECAMYVGMAALYAIKIVTMCGNRNLITATQHTTPSFMNFCGGYFLNFMAHNDGSSFYLQ